MFPLSGAKSALEQVRFQVEEKEMAAALELAQETKSVEYTKSKRKIK